jgi:CRISPR-associated protein Csb3
VNNNEFVGTTIQFNADPTNPGQFFACCGLLEIADRLWDGVDGWFEDKAFHCRKVGQSIALEDALAAVRDLNFENTGQGDGESSSEDIDETDDESDGELKPILIEKPIQLLLDWWKDKSLKTWAGSMDERKIFSAMCNAIDTENRDPFSQVQVVYDTLQRTKKREPFYFDSRRGANALAADLGFAPDALKMTSAAFPAVEALCFVGLQRNRPMKTEVPRVFDYNTWARPLPTTLVPVAVCGLLPNLEYQRYRFENVFRTDQKKHKAFGPATPLKGVGK